VLLLAGKGHEAYQEIGGRRLPFSDAAVAAAALARRNAS
jgi:UDP-N-acetylmuramyl tripeptide synthase